MLVLAQYDIAPDDLESILVMGHCPMCSRPVSDNDRVEWEGQEYHRSCFDEVVEAEARNSAEASDDEGE